MSVLCFHIGAANFFPGIEAGDAVYAFFLLSGFYIALGLNERYVTPHENAAFYVSRMLRLWPTYALSLLMAAYAGVLQQLLHFTSELPGGMAALAIFSNITMFGLDILTHVSGVDGHVIFSEWGIDPKQNGANFIVNMPAWSLSVEILFYLVAPFVVRSFKKSLIFLGIGLAYSLLFWKGMDIFPAGFRPKNHYPFFMVFFGLGICSYWLHRLYPMSIPNAKYYVALAVAAYATLLPSESIYSPLYAALAVVTPFLFHKTKHSSLDKFLGDLAYPIYILHIPVGMVVRSTGIQAPSALTYFAAAMTASILALLIIDRPLEHLRHKIFLRRREAVRSAASSPNTARAT